MAGPPKAGASGVLTGRWGTEAGVFGDLPSPQNLEHTAGGSETYPATQEPQAIRGDTGTSQLNINPACRDRSSQEGCTAERGVFWILERQFQDSTEAEYQEDERRPGRSSAEVFCWGVGADFKGSH